MGIKYNNTENNKKKKYLDSQSITFKPERYESKVVIKKTGQIGTAITMAPIDNIPNDGIVVIHLDNCKRKVQYLRGFVEKI